eukprot:3760876-Karenia_brevis.AAC.1
MRTRERSKRSKLTKSKENVAAAERLSREDVEVRAPREDEGRVKREVKTELWKEKRNRLGVEGVDFNNSEEDEDERPRER